MYSAEGSSGGRGIRMNYYVPRDEVKPYKKPVDLYGKPRYIPRILVRRFALTRTAYKYLDIGISVGSASFVELHLGDNRGNYIILPHETWTTFIERRADIERFLQSNTPSPLSIQDLAMEHVKINGATVVKITLHDSCIYLKSSTVLFLFELEYCINHEYLKLCHNIQDVNESFDRLVSILQSNMFSAERDEAVKLLRDNYDKTSVIDCELVAYAVDEILYDCLRRGDVY